MTLNEFISKYNNKGVEIDGSYLYQCMDLMHRYIIDVLGLPRSVFQAPTASKVWNLSNSNFTKISNSWFAVPQAGDIIIWGKPYGKYIEKGQIKYAGHVAIFDSGNMWSFTSFDQNWPTGSLCHLQSHNYSGVLGWFRPKKAVTTPPPATSTSFTVRVDKASAAVRVGPNTQSALGGSKILYKGATFISVGTVTGESVSGNNVWYKSAKGNYVWSGGLSRI